MWLAAAAGLVMVVAGAWIATRRPVPSWGVTRLEGAPTIGAGRIGDTGRLAVGEWLETDSVSRATVDVSAIGRVEVEPNTRLRLLRTRLTEHRMNLARGVIRATIWAPPRLFFVETPSAVAIDLGCRYTLEVDDAGAGLLRVEFGWVGFEHRGREAFTPGGAECATRPGFGPGTPYYEDASNGLRAALARLDFEKLSPDEQRDALGAALAECRPRDGLTLWHLLTRVPGDGRGRVYDRMAALIPPPAGVTRDGVLGGDRSMIDRWWSELGLGDTSWWRLWKQPWDR